jgi:Flp pilus assembly secretin CpaC
MMNRNNRFQFRIATLFWLMACVACFFGGRYWHLAGRYQNKMTRLPADSGYIILAGRSGIVNSPFRVTRVEADDATIATVSPLAQNSFSVAAHRAGTTTVKTWGPSPNETRTWEIVVKSPYPPPP